MYRVCDVRKVHIPSPAGIFRNSDFERHFGVRVRAAAPEERTRALSPEQCALVVIIPTPAKESVSVATHLRALSLQDR